MGKRRSKEGASQSSSRSLKRVRAHAYWLASRFIRLVPPILGILAVACLAFAVRTGWRKACLSPHLSVRNLEVRGLARIPREALISRAEAALGQPILSVDLDAMALRIQAHPWVSQVTIRRRLPDKLRLDIVEHRPWLIVSLGQMFLADKAGNLFKRFEHQDALALPLVTGLSPILGKENPVALRARVAEAANTAQAFAHHQEVTGSLEELHWDEDLGWSILSRPRPILSPELGELHSLPMRAHLGFSPVTQMLSFVASVQATRARGEHPKIVWADADAHLGRVHVELWDARDANETSAPVMTQSNAP